MTNYIREELMNTCICKQELLLKLLVIFYSSDSSSLPCSDDFDSMDLSVSSDTSKPSFKIVGVAVHEWLV